MQLAHIEFERLSISPLNMRHGKKAPDVSDILPSIRARGVLVPLLVRPSGTPESYEIVAGRRRWFSAKILREEGGVLPTLPCAILEEGDDAAALEASLIENIARLDPDEMSQYETFAALVKKGKTVPGIATTFGITERQVTQRLALGNLLPRIREAYRAEEIDAETVRLLTLASRAKQKEWLAFFDNARAPFGSDLKHWLFGGQSISTALALFPLENYPGEIVSDLFGEERYFADPNLFWERQNAAVAARRAAYLEAGWNEVVIFEPRSYFQHWEYEKTGKRKGGKVYIEVRHGGEVVFHEGYRSRKEAERVSRAGARQEAAEASSAGFSEVSSVMQNYLDLHRRAAVAARLIDEPAVALRLMAAHAIAGSGHWQVRADPGSAKTEAIASSLSASADTAVLDARRTEIAALLGLTEEDDRLVRSNGDSHRTVAVFSRILALSDGEVLRVVALIMAETLEAGSAAVEAAGVQMQVDPKGRWQPDDTFLELARDRVAVNALLESIAGKAVAESNLAAKAKAQRQIIRDCRDGTNGRAKAEDWLPGWMAFPPSAVTPNGIFQSLTEWQRVEALLPPW